MWCDVWCNFAISKFVVITGCCAVSLSTNNFLLLSSPICCISLVLFTSTSEIWKSVSIEVGIFGFSL